MKNVELDVKEITDWYLDNPEKTFYKKNEKEIIDVLEYVRIRKEDDTWVRCYKTRHVDAQGHTSQGGVDETDRAADKNILNELQSQGYTIKAIIDKRRYVYLVDDVFEVAIDKIKRVQVGSKELKKFKDKVYVEVELKSKCQDTEKGRKEIKDFLKKRFKLNQIKEFDRGYICIFLNPDHNFSKTTYLK